MTVNFFKVLSPFILVLSSSCSFLPRVYIPPSHPTFQRLLPIFRSRANLRVSLAVWRGSFPGGQAPGKLYVRFLATAIVHEEKPP
ncbi:hypothetical protein QBC35DRAFT_158971 [Podospora australis]|uniref:Secreted protein n=1 Tax=Podospora australis TaxID=1536484 RepID=A0AAN6X2J3_9PEZI|nr:hypothetical protein QBC35DRAFT_158971 [Podospora australis]